MTREEMREQAIRILRRLDATAAVIDALRGGDVLESLQWRNDKVNVAPGRQQLCTYFDALDGTFWVTHDGPIADLELIKLISELERKVGCFVFHIINFRIEEEPGPDVRLLSSRLVALYVSEEKEEWAEAREKANSGVVANCPLDLHDNGDGDAFGRAKHARAYFARQITIALCCLVEILRDMGGSHEHLRLLQLEDNRRVLA